MEMIGWLQVSNLCRGKRKSKCVLSFDNNNKSQFLPLHFTPLTKTFFQLKFVNELKNSADGKIGKTSCYEVVRTF